MKKKTWFKLDNAAKIYPATSNSRRSAVFGLSAVLDEKIDKDTLNDAINVVLNRFPTFKVKLKRGIFWYYLEENKKQFFVAEEPPYFLQFINEKESNDYLFRVFYLNNKITLAIFHSLTDGTGGLELLKAVVFEYLLLKGKNIKAGNELKTIYSPFSQLESEDKFLQVFDKKTPKAIKDAPAFKVGGTSVSNMGIGIITAKMPVDKVKEIAKKHNTTITALFSALLLKSVYNNYIKDKKVKNKNLRVLVPVNMRKFYPTQSVRNFAMFTRVGANFSSELSLEECIELCDKQLKTGTTKEVLDTVIAGNVKVEKNFFLKMAPLFIKDLAMKIAYSYVGDNLHTSTLSNLGVVEFPESVQKYVKDIIFTLVACYSDKHVVGMVSYDGFINVTFSREFVETNIEKDFIRFFTSNSVPVEVFSNYWEDNQ